MTCVGADTFYMKRMENQKRGSVNVFSIDLFWWKNDQSNAGIHHSGCKKKRKSIYDREKCTSAFDDFCIWNAKRRSGNLTVWRNDMFQSGEIIWCSVGAFFPNVLYLSPVLNTYLQELSEKVYKELLKTADVKVHKCYRPMQWVPHATIGKKLSKEEMLAAFQVLQEQFGVFSSRVVRIGFAKTNPYEELWNFELWK